jgi:heme oxygenase
MDTILSTPTFLENLRTITAQEHEALEALPVSVSILNPKVTNEEYGLYLALMRDIVKDAEQNVFPVLKNIVSDLPQRLRLDFIENDIQTIGYNKAPANATPLSSDERTKSPAFALGIFYVLEGSTLGGRVILKNINAALGYDAQNGARYFEGYGGETGSTWRRFLGEFSAYEAQNNTAEAIIAGANFAYQTINKHFTDNAAQ